MDAMTARDYSRIHGFGNENLDCPAALIVYSRYVNFLGVTPRVLEHTDASAFLGPGIPETTTYFVLAGFEKK
jgi:hypothetical protein